MAVKVRAEDLGANCPDVVEGAKLMHEEQPFRSVCEFCDILTACECERPDGVQFRTMLMKMGPDKFLEQQLDEGVEDGSDEDEDV